MSTNIGSSIKMISDLIKKLTKIRKTYDNIDLYYVYSDLSEMNLVKLEEVFVVYAPKEIINNSNVISAKEANTCISVNEYDKDKHLNYVPIALITEKI